ncbi:hypothetical protein [Anabaena sp. UHCC 0253]|uniref:hypothetical protein n=1 Tax=Anabaena sp. UHCC 0253 TaxID=2590019 RepID=UPI0014457166|nr:hypothetical protein [Anabaena sp. UHCC 0253]
MLTNYNLEVSTCAIAPLAAGIAPKSKLKYHNIVCSNVLLYSDRLRCGANCQLPL